MLIYDKPWNHHKKSINIESLINRVIRMSLKAPDTHEHKDKKIIE